MFGSSVGRIEVRKAAGILTGASDARSGFEPIGSQVPVIEQAIETAALMLGTDKSRGYCNPDVLLQSILRFFNFLPGEERKMFLDCVAEKAPPRLGRIEFPFPRLSLATIHPESVRWRRRGRMAFIVQVKEKSVPCPVHRRGTETGEGVACESRLNRPYSFV